MPTEVSWANTTDYAGLLDRLGTHWSAYFDDNGAVEQLLKAAQELDRQTCVSYDETARLLSRFTAPVYRVENWYAFTVSQLAMNTRQIAYGGGQSYGSGFVYGAATTGNRYHVAIPADLADVPIIANGIRNPSRVLFRGIDFEIADGYLVLRTNPFADAAFAKEEIFKDGVVADMTTTLWFFKSTWDRDYLYTHFGYALDLDLASSSAYRDLINVISDACVQGTNRLHIQRFFSALTGIPLCVSDGEVVELVQTDRNYVNVITDAAVYRFPAGSTPTVAVGDVLSAGQSMVDRLVFYDLAGGTVPAAVASLTMSPGYIPGDYVEGITFHNKDVAIQTETVDGKTKVTFDVGGFPTDVDAFWQTVHDKGVASGQTLANLLDIRANPTTEPTAVNLPATINPLAFLVENLLRYNLLVVHVRAGQLNGGIGLEHGNLLTRILPPWFAVITLIDLLVSDGPTDMVATGAGAGYSTNPVPSEDMDLSQGETAPTLRGINCYCL